MVQYIPKGTFVYIDFRDPRNREVVFSMTGAIKEKIALEQSYDAMDLVLDGVPLGKYRGPHEVRTELGLEKLPGRFSGEIDINLKFFDPEKTQEEVIKEIENSYLKIYGKFLDEKSMIIRQRQPLMPLSMSQYHD